MWGSFIILTLLAIYYFIFYFRLITLPMK